MQEWFTDSALYIIVMRADLLCTGPDCSLWYYSALHCNNALGWSSISDRSSPSAVLLSHTLPPPPLFLSSPPSPVHHPASPAWSPCHTWRAPPRWRCSCRWCSPPPRSPPSPCSSAQTARRSWSRRSPWGWWWHFMHVYVMTLAFGAFKSDSKSDEWWHWQMAIPGTCAFAKLKVNCNT